MPTFLAVFMLAGFLCLPGQAAAPLLVAEPWGVALEQVRDSDYFGPEGQGRLLRVRDRGHWGDEVPDFSNGVTVFVHGMGGSIAHWKALLEESLEQGVPSYGFVYRDKSRSLKSSGQDLAFEILRLINGHEGTTVRIAATSAGALVARSALNDLAFSGEFAAGGHSVSLYAVDAPWTGYTGPSDRGFDAFMMFWVRPFMGDGVADVRAASDFFVGTRPTCCAPAMPGLLEVKLPANFRVDPVFAMQGSEALDYTEGELSVMPTLWARSLNEGVEMSALGLNLRQGHFWRALESAGNMPSARAQALALAERKELTPLAALGIWSEEFPRFPGNHVGVLDAPSLRAAFSDWMRKR